jgi:hypothetical protein
LVFAGAEQLGQAAARPVLMMRDCSGQLVHALHWGFCACLCVLGLLACGAVGPTHEVAPPVLHRLGPDTWWVAAARGTPDANNRGVTAQLLVARDGERLWLVGSGPTPDFGAALAVAIQQTTGRSVTDIIHTRAAPELAMGNAAFPPARLWALPEVARAMQARCLECQQKLKSQIGAAGVSLRPEAIRAPNLHVLVGTAEIGPFDWRALPRDDGDAVLVLRHRSDAVVLAQGLLWAGDVPDLRNTGPALADSLRALQAWSAGQHLIGEQGGTAQTADIVLHLTYIDALQQAVQQRLQRGEVWGGAISQIELPAFAHLPSYAARHAANVQHVWLAMEPLLFR